MNSMAKARRAEAARGTCANSPSSTELPYRKKHGSIRFDSAAPTPEPTFPTGWGEERRGGKIAYRLTYERR